ncbi:MAG: purine nucleoside phosphorylase [Epsilonproteobacteria bacterium (ex Lamellibrachia satsuma)]|nr:MAG: purine nucleoside phosphorylase [Epsilonproteobacteria bacterium (ex Lamellibrachia satsuma)]
MIICAGESEQFDFAIPVGIGMIDVAINLTKLCMENLPDSLIFVGTAGSYGDKEIFDIIESRTAANIENSFFAGGSYTPIESRVSMIEDVSRETYEADNSSSCVGLKPERWSKLTRISKETVVNSSNYITTDKQVSKYYLENNIHLENMEFYAVLKVAKAFGIPAEGILIVTNYCDENAHSDFLKNHKEAMKKLDAYVKNMIKEQMVEK